MVHRWLAAEVYDTVRSDCGCSPVPGSGIMPCADTQFCGSGRYEAVPGYGAAAGNRGHLERGVPVTGGIVCRCSGLAGTQEKEPEGQYTLWTGNYLRNFFVNIFDWNVEDTDEEL